jgi:hypothetical protein
MLIGSEKEGASWNVVEIRLAKIHELAKDEDEFATEKKQRLHSKNGTKEECRN